MKFVVDVRGRTLVYFKDNGYATKSSLMCVKVIIRQCGNLLKIKKINFLQLYCPNGICPMGNSGCFPQGKPAATESRYPTYCACWVF